MNTKLKFFHGQILFCYYESLAWSKSITPIPNHGFFQVHQGYLNTLEPRIDDNICKYFTFIWFFLSFVLFNILSVMFIVAEFYKISLEVWFILKFMQKFLLSSLFYMVLIFNHLFVYFSFVLCFLLISKIKPYKYSAHFFIFYSIYLYLFFIILSLLYLKLREIFLILFLLSLQDPFFSILLKQRVSG